MFDLHMHTNLSDGSLSTKELISRLEEAGIKFFSITDHNHALAYENLKTDNLTMITGTEIATSYDGVIIELLGYHIDVEKINDWYHDFYSEENLIRNEKKLFEELIERSHSLGYRTPQDFTMDSIIKGASKQTIYYYLKDKYKDFPYDTYRDFFRQGLSNPQSDWFIDEGRYYPSSQEVINLIHQAGGLVFLAHPHEYGIADLETLYQDLLEEGLDGIESFHPSASMKESIQIIEYCNKKGIHASGGSDFHRDERLIPHGVHIHDHLLKNKSLEWIFKE